MVKLTSFRSYVSAGLDSSQKKKKKNEGRSVRFKLIGPKYDRTRQLLDISLEDRYISLSFEH